MDIYGITNQADSDFWREVKLRAMNNFGPWADKQEARMKVWNALEDVLTDILLMAKTDKNVSLIAEEMEERD